MVSTIEKYILNPQMPIIKIDNAKHYLFVVSISILWIYITKLILKYLPT